MKGVGLILLVLKYEQLVVITAVFQIVPETIFKLKSIIKSKAQLFELQIATWRKTFCGRDSDGQMETIVICLTNVAHE